MKLTKFEQSGFILQTDKSYKLAIDIGSYSPVEKLSGISPDAMLVSHIHGDHFSIEQIKKLSPKKIYLIDREKYRILPFCYTPYLCAKLCQFEVKKRKANRTRLSLYSSGFDSKFTLILLVVFLY